MKIEHNIENTELLKELDRLAVSVPAKTDDAAQAMADVILPALIKNAPYDGSSAHRDKHLKEVIKVTAYKSKNSKKRVIWVKPRGISGATQGRKAKKNWDKDKHIYKLVVSEYGRSNLPAKPFWTPTVQVKAETAYNAAINLLKKEL